MSIAQKMKELVDEIGGKLADTDSCGFSTCDCAHFGWDAEKHHAMHALARQGVPGKRWRIQHAVKFEVTDWTVIDEGKLAEALSPATYPALLKDMDAVEINRCVRLDDPASGECTEVWPEDEELPEATALIGEPFYTVFGHYRPGSGKQGVEALCDCPSRPLAELIANLLEAAIGQTR